MISDTQLTNPLRTMDLPSLKRIRGVDLTRSPEHRALWKPGRGPRPSPDHKLPEPGFALPMGFWLTEAVGPASDEPHPFTIRFEPFGTPASPAVPRTGTSSGPQRPEQTVRLKPPQVGDGDLVLKISSDGVRITTSDAVWKALSEPVLLAVGQYWRFLTVEAEIDRLTEEAFGDLDHATLPRLSTLKQRNRLIANAKAVRALVLDLPHFEGPLTDPFPYCSTELAAQTYLALAEKLRLEEWCELIDERAEAIEDTYESVSEKLLEFKNFSWEAVLEILIVVILLCELGLTLWEMFGP